MDDSSKSLSRFDAVGNFFIYQKDMIQGNAYTKCMATLMATASFKAKSSQVSDQTPPRKLYTSISLHTYFMKLRDLARC